MRRALPALLQLAYSAETALAMGRSALRRATPETRRSLAANLAYAFALRGQQIRYFAVTPKREEKIKEVELRKGPDATAPVVMAVTVETR